MVIFEWHDGFAKGCRSRYMLRDALYVYAACLSCSSPSYFPRTTHVPACEVMLRTPNRPQMRTFKHSHRQDMSRPSVIHSNIRGGISQRIELQAWVIYYLPHLVNAPKPCTIFAAVVTHVGIDKSQSTLTPGKPAPSMCPLQAFKAGRHLSCHALRSPESALPLTHLSTIVVIQRAASAHIVTCC